MLTVQLTYLAANEQNVAALHSRISAISSKCNYHYWTSKHLSLSRLSYQDFCRYPQLTSNLNQPIKAVCGAKFSQHLGNSYEQKNNNIFFLSMLC